MIAPFSLIGALMLLAALCLVAVVAITICGVASGAVEQIPGET